MPILIIYKTNHRQQVVPGEWLGSVPIEGWWYAYDADPSKESQKVVSIIADADILSLSVIPDDGDAGELLAMPPHDHPHEHPPRIYRGVAPYPSGINPGTTNPKDQPVAFNASPSSTIIPPDYTNDSFVHTQTTSFDGPTINEVRIGNRRWVGEGDHRFDPKAGSVQRVTPMFWGQPLNERNSGHPDDDRPTG